MAEEVARRVFSYFNLSKSGKLEGMEMKHFIAFEYLMDDMKLNAADVTDSQVEETLQGLGCAGKGGCPEEDFVKVILGGGKSVEDLLKLEESTKKYFESINV